MSETSDPPTSGGQFCGNCGAAVKAYWSSCVACGTPIEVRPVGSFEPVAAAAAPPPAAPPSGCRPARCRPASARSRPICAAAAPAGDSRRGPLGGSPFVVRSGRPLVRAAAAGVVAARTSELRMPLSYRPPPPGYGPTAGYPGLQPADGPVSRRSVVPVVVQPRPPPRAKSGSRPWIIATIVLVVLLLGAGVFGVIAATSLSSKNKDLVTRTNERDDARSQLTTAEAALNDANSTKANQSSQLAADKACITDLNILFASASRERRRRPRPTSKRRRTAFLSAWGEAVCVHGCLLPSPVRPGCDHRSMKNAPPRSVTNR